MRPFLIVLAALLGGVAHADPPEIAAGPASDVVVTIYRDDLALITETREVDLPGGSAKVLFEGVLDSVIAPSAVIRGFEGAEAERNFDFDGLDRHSLLNRSIGEHVSVVRTHKKTGRVREEDATIIAASDGVALQFADRYEALGCSGLPEKLVFQRITPNLRAKPTLSTLISDAPAGKRMITLSYLAHGVEWNADYVVTLHPGAKRADVTAWLTLDSTVGQGFEDARVGVVAGDLSRLFDDDTIDMVRKIVQRACWPMKTTSDAPWRPHPPPPPPPAPAMAMMDGDVESLVVTAQKRSENIQDVPIAQREELGDYQLYTLPERTALQAMQTKQVMFLDKRDVQTQIIYRYEMPWAEDLEEDLWESDIVVKFVNKEEDGLGEPLPGGDARVMAPSAHGVLYAGESETRDTAVGLDWELEIGASAMVTVEPKLASTKEEKLDKRRTRRSFDIEAEIANATSAPATVEIAQPIWGGSQSVSRANVKWTTKHGAPLWTIALKPGEQRTLRYRVTYIDG